MSLLVVCKNEEDPIKNEGARVVITLFIIFSDALWLVLLAARMNENEGDPKMMVLEWSQQFSHYKYMGIFPDAQPGQLTHKSLVQSCPISNPFEILWLYSITARIKGPPRGFGDLGRMAIYFQGAGEHW